MTNSEPDDFGPQPPKARLRYTLVVTGNSHDEITQEILAETRGGYLLHSDYETRETFETWGGRKHATLELQNPDMTPELWDEALHEWSIGRRRWRAQREEGR